MPVIVYLDMCCLKRAFDDQRSPRIQMETAAVAALMDAAAEGRIRLAGSPAHEFENDRNPRDDRRLAAALWLATADQRVALEAAVEERARTLATAGFARSMRSTRLSRKPPAHAGSSPRTTASCVCARGRASTCARRSPTRRSSSRPSQEVSSEFPSTNATLAG